MAEGKAFTGRSRKRTTTTAVRVTDVLAKSLITIGGVGTIFAVFGVCIYLVSVVIPLFQPAEIAPARTIYHNPENEALIQLGFDEYRVLGWKFTDDGVVTSFRFDNGEVRDTHRPGKGKQLTAASFSMNSRQCIFAYEDGTVQVVAIRYQTDYLPPEKVDEATRKLLEEHDQGHAVNFKTGAVQLTPQNQYRTQRLVVEPQQNRKISDKPVRAIAHIDNTRGTLVVAVVGSGEDVELLALQAAEKENMMTGEKEFAFRSPVRLPYKALQPTAPKYLAINEGGSDVIVAWETGEAFRVNCRDPQDAFVTEWGRLVEPGRKLTLMQYMLGDRTLIFGDDLGNVYSGFTVSLKQPRVGEMLSEAWLAANEVDRELAQQKKRDFLTRWEMLPTDRERLLQEWLWMQAKNPREWLAGPGLYDATYDFEQIDDTFVRAKQLPGASEPLSALGVSPRSRLIVLGHEDGTMRLVYVTHAGEIGVVTAQNKGAVEALVVTPKEDAFVAVTESGAYEYKFVPKHPGETPKPGHPGVTLSSWLTRQWYEGYKEPGYTWQSSAATTGAEEKLSLTPLIFGTLKATFYSMIFGAPLALLAAIFSSEFLHPRAKAVIKPTVELMASLPSVVLGFLAGLVFAPFVEDVVPATLASFFLIPLAIATAAFVWQMMPQTATIRLSNWRPLVMVVPIVLGLLVAYLIGPLIEQWLFAGDIRQWTSWTPNIVDLSQEKYRSAFGGWMLLLTPLAAVGVAVASGRVVNPRLRSYMSGLDRGAMATFLFLKFAAGIALTLAVAAMLAMLLDVTGFDPRAPLILRGLDFAPIGTYIQRNALVVGFAMGFAIIPIIYTIADDALSSVPEHLRGGSLGCGATPWQTATRIIIPTAMSGLFSAVMIGLGRAVGETMIVLMAAGNTPVLELNMFNGFRTLSANIAVELPEAVQNSTHYRMLFLAGLVLFAMTFVLNTVAEFIRQQFRKRAYQL